MLSATAELRFGPFRLLGRNGPLLRGGSEVKLQPKAIAVLWALLRQNGQVLSRTDLLDAVWPGAEVGDEALSRTDLLDAVWPGAEVGDEALTFQVQGLRKALEDDPRKPSYIVTVHRVGFRFGVPVQQAAEEAPNRLFVGRDAELARLRALYGQACAGRRQLVLISGEAGIGKSALIEAFLGQLVAGGQAPRIGQGQCADRPLQSEPYLPVLDALGQLLREFADESDLELVRRVAPNWLVHLPALLAPAEVQQLRQQNAGTSQERMLREMVEALALLSREQPLVLVLEDLHWSDPSTLKLLHLIASHRQAAQLLILCSCRPPEGEDADDPLRRLQRELIARGHAEELALGYLGLGEVRQYLSGRTAALGEDDGRALRIYERSAGHPLFLAQLTDYLLQNPDEETADGELPPRLRDLIGLQLAQLPLSDQLLLEVAAVCAEEFSAASIADCTAVPVLTVESQLERLARAGRFVEDHGLSVWPDGTTGGRYGFRHVLYRVALRQRLSATREARLRLRIAERLEQAYGARVAEIAAELAQHYELAGQTEKAIFYCLATARRALERLAAPEARQLCQRGLHLLVGLPAGAERDQTELSLLLMLVAAWHLDSGYPASEALPSLLRIRTLIATVKEPTLLEPALHALWASTHFRCQLEESLDYAHQLRDLGVQRGNAAMECSGLAFAGPNLNLLGRPRDAAEQASASLRLIRESERGGPGVQPISWYFSCTALTSLAIVSWYLGTPDRSLELAREARQRAEGTGNAATICTVSAALTSILFNRREWTRLITAADEVMALCEQYGHRDSSEWVQMHRLVALAMLGDPEPPLEALRVITARRQRASSYIGLPSIYISEAEVQLRQGRHGAAVAALDKARDLVSQRQMRAWEPELLRVEAELSRARGETDPELVEGRLRQSLAICEERSSYSLGLRSAISLARLRGAAARAPLQQIYDRITEGRESPDLREAAELLARLGAA